VKLGEGRPDAMVTKPIITGAVVKCPAACEGGGGWRYISIGGRHLTSENLLPRKGTFDVHQKAGASRKNKLEESAEKWKSDQDVYSPQLGYFYRPPHTLCRTPESSRECFVLGGKRISDVR